jgi:hypothetical protein
MHKMVIMLSVFAGAVHVMAPDHWIPASMLSWQRGWGFVRAVAFSTVALLFHVLFGFGVYLGLHDWLIRIPENDLFPFALLLVSVMALVRAFRFSDRGRVVRLGTSRIWGTMAVFSLLGPSESVIPILLKAGHLGIGYPIPLAAFAAGTVFSGAFLLAAGRFVWNHPLWLSRSLGWAHQRATVVPIAASVVVGLAYLFRV